MKLQRLYVDIDEVIFDSRSYIVGHTLHVSPEELGNILCDSAFARLELDIAPPGSSCRIVNVGDVVQPMVKLDSADETFPGIIGRIKTAGSGKSLLLRGIAVTEVVEVKNQNPSFLEMTESGADNTDLAKVYHITLDAFPAAGVSKNDYLMALHRASKKLAQFLALLAKDCMPDAAEEFTLEYDGLEGLPRVAYLADVFCHAPFTEMTLYGESMAAAMPVIIHPNELIDGTVTNRDYDNARNADPTYIWQNHPIIFELYRRHGIDLNFVGVVLSNIHHTVEWKQRNAAMAAALVRWQLEADGCIITKEGGGHPQVDMGFAADLLEGEYSIKTTLLLAEFLSPNNDSYGQLLFKSQHADAIVSAGCYNVLDLPAVDKVIGHIPPVASENGELTGPISIANRSLRACESQLGWTRFGSLKF